MYKKLPQIFKDYFRTENHYKEYFKVGKFITLQLLRLGTFNPFKTNFLT